MLYRYCLTRNQNQSYLHLFYHFYATIPAAIWMISSCSLSVCLFLSTCPERSCCPVGSSLAYCICTWISFFLGTTLYSDYFYLPLSASVYCYPLIRQSMHKANWYIFWVCRMVFQGRRFWVPYFRVFWRFWVNWVAVADRSGGWEVVWLIIIAQVRIILVLGQQNIPLFLRVYWPSLILYNKCSYLIKNGE